MTGLPDFTKIALDSGTVASTAAAVASDQVAWEAPEGIAINPVTNRIYTANSTDNSTTVIDGATDQVIATVKEEGVIGRTIEKRDEGKDAIGVDAVPVAGSSDPVAPVIELPPGRSGPVHIDRILFPIAGPGDDQTCRLFRETIVDSIENVGRDHRQRGMLVIPPDL